MKDTYLKWQAEMLRLPPVFALLVLAFAALWWGGIHAGKHLSPGSGATIVFPSESKPISAN